MLWKWFAYNGTYRYVDDLQKIVSEYNASPHRGIGGRKPKDVINSKRMERELLKTVYNHPKIFLGGRFKKGQFVRVADYPGVFDKGYEPNFSTAVFVITKVHYTYPVTYSVADKETGNVLVRKYYQPELRLVRFPDVYLIKNVLKRKKGKILVSWLGYGPEKNSWISDKDLV